MITFPSHHLFFSQFFLSLSPPFFILSYFLFPFLPFVATTSFFPPNNSHLSKLSLSLSLLRHSQYLIPCPSLPSSLATGLPPYQFGSIGLPVDQRTHEGRYAWPNGPSASSCGPTGGSGTGGPTPAQQAAAQVLAANQAAAAAASQALALSASAAAVSQGAFSRLSPYEQALYPSLHSSPSALSSALRNLSPGEKPRTKRRLTHESKGPRHATREEGSTFLSLVLLHPLLDPFVLSFSLLSFHFLSSHFSRSTRDNKHNDCITENNEGQLSPFLVSIIFFSSPFSFPILLFLFYLCSGHESLFLLFPSSLALPNRSGLFMCAVLLSPF